MLVHGVLVQGWLGVCGCFLVLCDSLSLFNASHFPIFWPLSVEWPVVVLFCRCDLSSVVATPLPNCAILVVWPLLDLTYFFAAISARPFSVQALGLYGPFCSISAFSTPFMLSVWTCGDVGRWLDFCLFLSLGCIVFPGHFMFSLQVCRFSCSALCYDRVLADSCMYTSLGASSTSSLLDVWPCVAIGCFCACSFALVWTAWCWGVLSGVFLLALRFCCLWDSATAGEFMLFPCRHVSPSLHAWGLLVLLFHPPAFLLSCIDVHGVILESLFWGRFLASRFFCCCDSATASEFMAPSRCIPVGGLDVWWYMVKSVCPARDSGWGSLGYWS